MKLLKDLFSVSENKNNKQSIWNPKKKEFKKLGIKEEDLLNLNLKKLLKK
jgi:hypothetical protein